MAIQIDQVVMLPGYQPYPRYGRVAQLTCETALVTDVRCGDPRCASEHHHADQTWGIADLLAARAYQPRARWELGRMSSPNTPLS